jgi:hypothetical protein
MVDKIQKLILNDKGQAVFELVIFLPFLIFLYSIYYTAGNSISGSINQQKAVRGYFYSLTKGNSYLNSLGDLNEYSDRSIKAVGFSTLGWREKSSAGGQNGFAPCFKFSSILKNEATEECDGSDREGEGSSRFIRVFTYYGVCGPVYTESSDTNGKFFEIIPSFQNSHALCSISNDPPS